MCSVTAAMNGLKRSISYTKEKRDSSSAFYSSTIENLNEIKALAEQLIQIVDEALAKAENFQDQELESSETQLIPIVEVEEVADINEVKASFEIPSTSRTYLKKLKSTVNALGKIDLKQYEFKPAKECIDLACQYFDVRFDKRNDPNHIHVFDQKCYINYLASFVLDYANHYIDNTIDEFKLMLYSWLDDVKLGLCKYTMPPDMSYLFFEMVNSDNVESCYSYEAYIVAQDIWKCLWDLGLSDCARFELKTQPNREFSWFNLSGLKVVNIVNSCKHLSFDNCLSYPTVFDLALAKYVDETNTDINPELLVEIESVFMKYCEFTLSSCYSIFQNYEVSKEPKLNIVFDDKKHNISEGTIAKALIFYLSSGKSSCEDLIQRLNDIKVLEQSIETKYKTFAAISEAIKEYDIESLDLLEVFIYYIDNYTEFIKSL